MIKRRKARTGSAAFDVHLVVRNDSARKRLYRADELRRLAERVCAGEGVEGAVELSVLFCDDPFIRELNARYRKTDRPTDVLSFSQDRPAVPVGPVVLGDVVISLETVEGRCDGDRAAMRDEVRLLFCHGLLHLLNYTHATARARRHMAEKQAEYLRIPVEGAWLEPAATGRASRRRRNA